MLTYMRKNAGSWIIKVIFVAIIITFIFFYGYGSKRGPEERVLASVGKNKITAEQYRTAYANMLQMYQQMYQNQITDSMARSLGLQQKLLDEMIERELILQESKRRNLLVSQEEIKGAIVGQPYMQENGVFSDRRYAAVLSRMKITAAEYEQQVAQEILLKSQRAIISQAVDVSDKELLEVFRLRGARLKIDYIEFAQSDITADRKVSEEELQDHYDQNAEHYRVDETVKAQYVVFDPKELVGRMSVEPEDIADFYKADQVRFFEPEQVRARHILLKTDAASGPEKAQEVQKQAQTLLEKIKSGADFAVLAKKYSQDEATASKGGDLGFFGRGTMVGPFEEAAFGLQPGQISEIIETQFGYHIIKIEEKRPERVRPLEEVREEIVRELQQEMAEKEVRTVSRRAFNRLFSSRDLDGYAKTNGLALKETDLFPFGKGPEDTQGENAFSQQAFALQSGEISPVFAINKKYYLIKLTDRKQSHIAPLEKVRGAVLAEVQRKKRLETARQQADNALKMLAENDFAWDAVAKKLRKEIKQVEVAQPGDFVPGIGRSPELKKAAFMLGAGQTADRAFGTDAGYILVRAREKTIPPDKDFEGEKKTLHQQLVQARQQEVFKQYIQTLKEQYTVDVDQKIFETL